MQDVPVAELEEQITAILCQSIEEVYKTRDTLSEQIAQSVEPQPLLSFLHEIALDLITELECIRPAEKRRQSMHEDQFTSPLKRREPIHVSEDTIKKVLLAIEKDSTLSSLVQSNQVVGLDRFARCVREKMTFNS